LEDQQTVYNFEVEDDHDYFVGKAGLLVHNDGPCFSTRSQAFQDAKAANDVPTSAQPDTTYTPDSPEQPPDMPLDDRNVRLYQFTDSGGNPVYIREDLPVEYPDGGYQGPHFNSGPAGSDLPYHSYWED
jgi:hypothetical protein